MKIWTVSKHGFHNEDEALSAAKNWGYREIRETEFTPRFKLYKTWWGWAYADKTFRDRVILKEDIGEKCIEMSPAIQKILYKADQFSGTVEVPLNDLAKIKTISLVWEKVIGEKLGPWHPATIQKYEGDNGTPLYIFSVGFMEGGFFEVFSSYWNLWRWVAEIKMYPDVPPPADLERWVKWNLPEEDIVKNE